MKPYPGKVRDRCGAVRCAAGRRHRRRYLRPRPDLAGKGLQDLIFAPAGYFAAMEGGDLGAGFVPSPP
jgi:hypothetical protein